MEQPAVSSPRGTSGWYQRFEGEAAYPVSITGSDRFGATIYRSAAHGSHVTSGMIGQEYERLHGTGSALGFPCSEEEDADLSPTGTRGRRQRFEGGMTYWSRVGGPHALSGEIEALYRRLGGSRSDLGFPVSNELRGQSSAGRTSGTVMRFEGGIICSSAGTGTRAVTGPIAHAYERLHGTAGALGFPTSDEDDAGPSTKGTTGRYQRFEDGAIFWSATFGGISVTSEMLALHEGYDGVRGRLGYPVQESAEEPGSGRRQRFEGGVIVVTADGSVRVETALARALRRFTRQQGTDAHHTLRSSGSAVPTDRDGLLE
jgi:serine protease